MKERVRTTHLGSIRNNSEHVRIVCASLSQRLLGAAVSLFCFGCSEKKTHNR